MFIHHSLPGLTEHLPSHGRFRIIDKPWLSYVNISIDPSPLHLGKLHSVIGPGLLYRLSWAWAHPGVTSARLPDIHQFMADHLSANILLNRID